MMEEQGRQQVLGGEDNMFIFRNIDFDVLGEHPGQTVPKAVGNVEFKFS